MTTPAFAGKLAPCLQPQDHTMKTVLSRPLRLPLLLAAALLLSACDTPQWLPPDAHLPDGSTYTGDIRDGLFHGQGVQTFNSGLVYRGEFRDGYWHGQGVLESPAGWRYEGSFREGMRSGHGVLEDERSRYEGSFRRDEFHGKGRYEVNDSVYVAEFVDGSPVRGMHITDYGTYQGEFRDWYYHGEGSYYYPGEAEGMGSLSGTWEDGEFVGGDEVLAESPEPPEPPVIRTETILAEDHQRLQDQIANLAPERPGVTDAYFLALGGDGTESVFMRDIQVAKAGLQAQFDIENRTIALLNHRDYESLPLATRPSLATALEALDQRMDPEEDLLVIHLVSHGGRDGELLLQQPGVELADLAPEDLAAMLEPLKVRRKVLVVSACYSGHWLNELRDDDSLIMVSAREDRTSFGCGDDSEMTWFTKAVYQSVGLSFSDPEGMFEQVEVQIRRWEEEIGMDEEQWSYPQFHLGESLGPWLKQQVPAAGG